MAGKLDRPVNGYSGKAIEFYQKAIELNPNLAEVYDKLGDTFAKVGRQKEASVCYRRCWN